MKTIKITRSALKDIIGTVGSLPAESGGLLFGSRDNFVIQKFLFDKNAKTTRASYTFDIEYLNPMIKKIWDEEGLALIGFLHSHPGLETLSTPDEEYFAKTFEYIQVDQLITPIVLTQKDGGFEMFCHVFYKDTMKAEEASYEVVPDDYIENLPVTIEENDNKKQSSSKKPTAPDSIRNEPHKVQQLTDLSMYVFLRLSLMSLVLMGLYFIYNIMMYLIQKLTIWI
jgi:proteasome lid subunit RPN8/RPN11